MEGNLQRKKCNQTWRGLKGTSFSVPLRATGQVKYGERKWKRRTKCCEIPPCLGKPFQLRI